MMFSQADKIRIALQMGLLADEIPKVGSVEEFQGGERKVMIISTVRSANENRIEQSVNKFGFLYNSKRFNVAITRAKSLMIIIGNPHVLQKDKRWKELLQYCLDLEAYTGCNLPVELDRDAKKLCDEIRETEAVQSIPTLPPDMPTKAYNPDGADDFDDD
jgi:helicase MOV-10